jgi:predicted metal-binding protein
VALYLEREGFETVIAYDGRQALELAYRHNPIFVVLDLMLPLIDGWEVCRQLRQSSPLYNICRVLALAMRCFLVGCVRYGIPGNFVFFYFMAFPLSQLRIDSCPHILYQGSNNPLVEMRTKWGQNPLLLRRSLGAWSPCGFKSRPRHQRFTGHHRLFIMKKTKAPKSLEAYWEQITTGRPAEAKEIDPKSVVTAPWVRLKCQYGCPRYGRGYCCPPDTPAPEQTRRILDSYNRAILFHLTAAKTESGNRIELIEDFLARVVDLEGEMFKNGFYKAFAILSGPCTLCKECGKLKGTPCHSGYRARPSMEACGIDVYQTAWNNDFPLAPLKDKKESQNIYSLMLVE